MSPQQREAALRLAYSADSAETCEYIGTDSWIREAAALLRSLAVEPQPAGPGDMAVYQAIADGYTHPPAKQEPQIEQEEALQVARAALADIGYSEDMPIAFAKAKARRIYEQTAPRSGE